MESGSSFRLVSWCVRGRKTPRGAGALAAKLRPGVAELLVRRAVPVRLDEALSPAGNGMKIFHGGLFQAEELESCLLVLCHIVPKGHRPVQGFQEDKHAARKGHLLSRVDLVEA